LSKEDHEITYVRAVAKKWINVINKFKRRKDYKLYLGVRVNEDTLKRICKVVLKFTK